MHRYRKIAQISLILSILNIVLASPIAVQKIHEARRDDSEMVVAEDVAVMPKKSRGLEIAPDRPAFSGSESPLDAMSTPQYSPSLDGSASSVYLTPDLSPDSGYSRSQELAYSHPSSSGLLETLPPHLPASLDESYPRPSITVSSETPPPWWKKLLGSETPSPDPPHFPSPRPSSTGSPETPSPNFSASLYESASPHTSSSSLSERPPYPPTPLHESSSRHFSSSGSWQYQWLDTPSPHPPESLHESASATPPGNADSELFNKSMMKKLGIVGALAIVGATVASVVVLEMKQHNHRDRQDS